MIAIAREVTGHETLTLTDPIWFSHSWFQHGASKQYRQGRVLLVGDAGHLTLPVGRQGMNAGFHDAVGVAWVLAGRAEPVCSIPTTSSVVASTNVPTISRRRASEISSIGDRSRTRR